MKKCNFGSMRSKLGRCALLLVLALTASCSDEQDVVSNNPLNLTRVSVPFQLEMASGDVFTLNGLGFQAGDRLVFTGDEGDEYQATTVGVSGQSLQFKLPDNIPGGKYKIRILREDVSMPLSAVEIVRVFRGDVPEVPGMNLKGIVHCNGLPLEGVVVTDGVEVVQTDANGYYHLPSKKENGYVSISVPGGYKVQIAGTQPVFYARLNADVNKTERNDFSLVKVKDTDYAVLAFADMHLAARTYDREQYDARFVPDVNALIADYKAAGKEVYAVTLGDQSWDSYWYANKFGLADVMPYINKINCPVWHCQGNHDYDPNYNTDREASAVWFNTLGPTYYSFNIGEVHYVVLDNIVYAGSGSSEEKAVVDETQMQWLAKDLQAVADKTTPVVVIMHAPLHGRPLSISNGADVQRKALDNYDALVEALSGFDNVTMLTGHIHQNYTAKANGGKIREYNIGSVCGTWWWTGHPKYAAQIDVCPDGSPAGYGVLEVSGKDVSEYYKSTGFGANYQFRSYDLNQVEITADKFCPNADATRMAMVDNYAGVYGTAGTTNEILVNVWGYGDGWSIEVTEGGKPLEVTRVKTADPMHIVTYEFQRMNVSATPTSNMVTINNIHMFTATASSATSTVEIKVTDRFGRVYTETMTRPKAFGYTMK